jgi:hypothetical protein
MEQTRCPAGDDDKALQPVLDGSALVSVRPLYSPNAGGGKAPESRLQGVVLTVLAQPGVTDVWLDRALECHSARASLGHIAAAADDPFYLPGSSVDIDVRPAKDGYDIIVNGYSTEDTVRIYGRAEAFAKAHNRAALRSAWR